MTATRKSTTPRKPTSFRRHLAAEAMKVLVAPRVKLDEKNLERIGRGVWLLADAVIEGEKTREDGDGKQDGRDV